MRTARIDFHWSRPFLSCISSRIANRLNYLQAIFRPRYVLDVLRMPRPHRKKGTHLVFGGLFVLRCRGRCRAAISKCAVDRAVMMMARHDQGCERWLWGLGENVRGMRMQNGRRGWTVAWVVPAVTQACVQHYMHHLLCHQPPALIISKVRKISTLGPECR